MALGSGLDGQVGIAVQTDYDTVATPTTFFEIDSEGIDPQVQVLESRPITGGLFDRVGRHREKIVGAGGDLVVNMLDKGMLPLLKAALGAVTTAQVSSTPEYKYTFTPDVVNGKRGLAYTVQVGRPQTDGTIVPFTHVGGKVTGFELASAMNAELKLTTTWDFKTVVTDEDLETPSYPASADLFTSLDGVLSIGGDSAATLTSVSIKGALGMKTDRISFGAIKREPLANAKWEITGEFAGEFESMDAFDAWIAGTEETNLIVTYTGVTIPTTANPFKVVITIPVLKYTGTAPKLSGPDLLQQNKPFKALDNGTDPIITVEVHTTDVSVP